MVENKLTEGVAEENEAKNKQKIINSGELLNQAKFDFIDEKLDLNSNYFNIEAKNFNEIVYDDFFKYVNDSSKYNYLAFNDLAKYTNEQKNTLTSQLKTEIIKIKISTDKNTQTLLDIIDNDYEFEDEIAKNKLKEEIEKVKSTDIKKILKSELERIKFLSKLNIKGIKKKEIKGKKSVLDKIDFEKINQKNLTEEQISVLKKFNNNHNLLEDKEYLVLLGILDKNEREYLLEYLNTSFSLEELIKYDILDKKEAVGYLVDSYKKIYPSLDTDELMEILNDNLDFANIYFTSSELRYEHISKILKNRNLLKEVFNDINEYKAEEQRAIQKDFYDNIELEYPKGDLDENGNYTEKGLIHNNFKNFLNSEINKENISISILNSLNNFEEGNYLEINKDGKKFYYYISKIDEGGTKEAKHIIVKKLTSEQNLSKVKSLATAEEEVISYKELYYIFRNFKKEGIFAEFINDKDFSNLDVIEADDENNIKSEEDLLEKLNSEKLIDPEHSNLKIKELALLDKTVGNKKLGDVSTYRTFSVDEATNSLVFDITGQRVTFSEFFDVLKEKRDYFKFEKKINTATEALKNIGLNSNYEIDGDKLVYIDKNKEKKEINYFLGKDGVALNIISISDGQVEFSYGKIKKSKDKKVGDKFEPIYSNKGFNSFVKDIGNDLKPDLKGIQLQDADNKLSHKKLEEKFSLWDAWMSCLSITEVISAGNMYIDAIKNHLEMGNQLKASQLAEKLGVATLANSVSVKLKTHTEAESKKLMEDLKNKVLTELNSKDAFEYIKKNILENKHVQTYETFAAMSFMLEKSGSLSAKGLLDYRGDYIWYQKLGGTVGDEFFMKVKAKYEQAKFTKDESGKPDPAFFTEEALVEEYLAKLSKEGKIFSRADKDFAGLRTKGHERRFKKGADEAGSEYTITARIDYFMAHLAKGEDDRALGALGKILGKNKSDPAIMNKAPFILAMGGFGKYYDGTNVGRLVGTAFETPYISVYFGTEQSLIDAYQGAIKQYFINKGEKSKADKLDKILSMKIGDKVKALGAFWDENGKDLVDFISFKDGNILLQKGTDKDPNGYYQTFYDTTKGVFDDPEFNYAKDNYLKTGMYKESAFASVKAKLGGAENLTSTQTFGYRGNSKHLAKIYYSRLLDIKNNSNFSEEIKYKLFSDIYNEFEEKVRNAFGGYLDRFSHDDPKGEFPVDLKNNNLVLDYGKHKRETREEFLRHAFEYFMNNEITKPNKIDEEEENTKEKVLDIMEFSGNLEEEKKGVNEEKDNTISIDGILYKKK